MVDHPQKATVICLISGTVCEIVRPLSTVKENEKFQVGIHVCPDKFQLEQIQNGRPGFPPGINVSVVAFKNNNEDVSTRIMCRSHVRTMGENKLWEFFFNIRYLLVNSGDI